MSKYTVEHLKIVEKLLLTRDITKTEAIRLAGFSDPKMYYHSLKNHGYTEVMLLKKKSIFLVKEH